MIKVSVIVPVYNVEKYLEQTIDSVINQTLKDIEIILIDDGSLDNSGIICDNYAKKDSRIVVFHQENQGVSAARNKGIELAKGEYISFVDSDDLVDEKMLEVLYGKGHSNDLDIVMCGFTTDWYGKKHKWNCNLKSEEIIHKNEISDFLVSYKNVFLVNNIYAKIHKRDFLLNNNIFFPLNLNIQEDTIFVLKTLLFAKSIYYIKESYYNYIKRNDSLTTKKYRENLHNFYNRAYLLAIELYETNNIPYIKKDLFYRIIIQMFNCMINVTNSNLSSRHKEIIYKEMGSLKMFIDVFCSESIKDFPFDIVYETNKKRKFLSRIKLNLEMKYMAFKFLVLKKGNFKLLSLLK